MIPGTCQLRGRKKKKKKTRKTQWLLDNSLTTSAKKHHQHCHSGPWNKRRFGVYTCLHMCESAATTVFRCYSAIIIPLKYQKKTQQMHHGRKDSHLTPNALQTLSPGSACQQLELQQRQCGRFPAPGIIFEDTFAQFASEWCCVAC